MIAIINYGLGNIANISNALRFLNYEVIVTNNPEELRAAEQLILPGVGHFKDAMKQINELNLQSILMELKNEKPIIGICLGMQLLFEHSQEGDIDGLGFLQGKVKKIKGDVLVPHLGWNTLNSDIPFLNEDVYFIHSYKVEADDSNHIVATSEYSEEIVAIVQNDSIIGIQFHPEKSGDQGLKILDKALKGGFSA